jgi:hypothetical protein
MTTNVVATGGKFPKGHAKRGGRVKGTPNKATADIKAMIIGALDKKGGIKYLVQQADENPVAFLGLVGKVLPMTVQGDADNPIQTTITVKWAGTSE